jgi:hypothetical protein
VGTRFLAAAPIKSRDEYLGQIVAGFPNREVAENALTLLKAVGALVFYKELCSVAIERMSDAERERDKLRARLREVMGLESDDSRQEHE